MILFNSPLINNLYPTNWYFYCFLLYWPCTTCILQDFLTKDSGGDFSNDLKSYCTHFLYCPAQWSWTDTYCSLITRKDRNNFQIYRFTEFSVILTADALFWLTLYWSSQFQFFIVLYAAPICVVRTQMLVYARQET